MFTVIFLSSFFYLLLTSQRTVFFVFTIYLFYTKSFRVGLGGSPPVTQTNKQFNHTSGYALINTSRVIHCSDAFLERKGKMWSHIIIETESRSYFEGIDNKTFRRGYEQYRKSI